MSPTMTDAKPTLGDIEEALDAGHLWYMALPHVYWQLRRNGRTQVWKTRPGHFSIPVKWGFRFAGRVDHADTVERGGAHGSIVISETRPVPTTIRR